MIPTLLLALSPLAWSPAPQAADTAAGQRIYNATCMACHGANADGRGPAAAALKPQPTNFTSAAFWKGRDDASIKRVIKAGKPGTAMMAFGQLSAADLDSLVAFLRSKAPE